MAGGSGGGRTPVRLLARRGRVQAALLAATLLTVLASAVGLAALVSYGASVPQQGLHALLTTDPARSTVVVSASLGADGPDRADAAVRTATDASLPQVPHDVTLSAVSVPYALPGRPTSPAGLTSFWYLADLEQHARLTEGSWPTDATAPGPVPVAVNTTAAELLGVRPGSRLRLANLTFGADVDVTVVGVYRATDPSDPVWALDPAGGAGALQGDFTTYGPLAVAPATFDARFAASAKVQWAIQPGLAEADADDLPAIRDGLASLRATITTDLGSGSQVRTDLDGLLDQASRALLVSRSTTPVPLLLLAALAAYAVGYVGWLLQGQRRGERVLLRARGMSWRQQAALTLTEAVLLVLPAVLLAPWIASAVLTWAAGPLGLTTADATGPVDPTATWATMLLVGAGAVLLVSLPALAHRPDSVRVVRASRRSAIARTGADLGLLAVAVLCYLQLRTAGSPFAAADARTASADPIYVIAPVLLLAAIALLGLRLLPLLAAAVERFALRSRGASGALGVWPVSRRASSHSGPVLLLVLALSVGVMSAVASATWDQSLQDQADFAVGADARVDLLPAPPAQAQRSGAEIASAAGQGAGMPVLRAAADTGGADGATTTLLALEAPAAPQVMLLRPDLSDVTPAAMPGLLVADADADEPAVPDGATSATLAVTLHLTLDHADYDLTPVVRDDRGLLHQRPAVTLPLDGDTHRVAVPLDAGSRTFAGLVIDLPPGLVVEEQTTITVDVLGPGGPSAFISDDLPAGQPGRVVLAPGLDPAASPAPLPGLATTALLQARGAEVGATIGTTVLGRTIPVKVVGELAALPTVGTAEALVVDLGSLQQRLLATGPPSEPLEWWLRTTPVDLAALQQVVGAPPEPTTAVGGSDIAGATMIDRWSEHTALQQDPLALGFLGALRIALVAGALFAAIGIVVSVLLTVRERRGELELLHALGMRSREVSRVLLVEQLVVLLLGTALGLVVGLAVSALVVPLTTVSARTGVVVPPALTIVPWWGIAVITAGLVVVLGLLVRLVMVGVARTRPAASLRSEAAS